MAHGDQCRVRDRNPLHRYFASIYGVPFVLGLGLVWWIMLLGLIVLVRRLLERMSRSLRTTASCLLSYICWIHPGNPV